MKNSKNEIQHFNFELEKVLGLSKKMKNNEESIEYLRKILRLKKNNKTIIDNSLDNPDYDFVTEVKAEIKRLKRTDGKSEKGKTEIKNTDNIVQIISKSGVSDIVRIFEAMFDSHIISMKTEVTQIAKMFFSDPLEAKNFTDQYYARKNDNDKFNRNSNSKELVKFIEIIIEKSFNKKETILDELADHIAKVRKS